MKETDFACLALEEENLFNTLTGLHFPPKNTKRFTINESKSLQDQIDNVINCLHYDISDF